LFKDEEFKNVIRPALQENLELPVAAAAVQGFRINSSLGNVGKIPQRRSHHFAGLTYSIYAPQVKIAAAFPSVRLRTGLDGVL